MIFKLNRGHRLYQKQLSNYEVSDSDLIDLETVISFINQIDGPAVEWDQHRNCYGLKTRQCYKKGDFITTYGGTKSFKEINGDYVAKGSEIYIDGRVGFKLSEKGRWINESDNKRTHINVKLGRRISAISDINKGEWLFADYGDEYIRNY